MSNFSENFGLDVLMDTEEHAEIFFKYILGNGKAIPNYYGYPYIFKSVGKPEYFARIKPGKEGKYEVCGFDSHCAGNCIWEMVHTGIDLTPEEFPKLNRVILMRKPDGDGMVPIELITADVYPSFLKGDKYKIQVIGLPISISYYADEDAYSDSLPVDEEGQKWGIAEGTLFPSGFLYNHDPDRQEGFDPETDKHVLFKGTVKKLSWGYVNITGEGKEAFLRCFIDTQYGTLELEHTFDQVAKEQLENIAEGSIVSGVCVLSGDLAIDEYEDGIVKDHEHDLRLLRYTFVKGEEERLKTVLKEDAVYISETTGKQYSGRDSITKQIRYVIDNRNCDLITEMATITNAEDGMEYSTGTRCFLLAYGEDKEFEAIVFIDVDEEGMISRIKISTDCRYHFKVDDKGPSKSVFEGGKMPDSVEEAMFLRAKATKGIRPWDETLEDFRNKTSKRKDYLERANRLLEKARETLHTGPLEKMEFLFCNLFARAFEDRLLEEIGVELPEPGVEEMFSDGMFCPLNPEWKPIFQKAGTHGKQYFKDYKNYCILVGKQESADELFISAAVMTQEIGEAYAVKHMEDAPIVYISPEED